MLGRKQSTTAEHSLLTTDYAEEAGPEGGDTERVSRQAVRRLYQFISLLSLVSVSANTPQTFRNYPALLYITYVADWLCLTAFAVEAGSKVRKRGLVWEGGYLRSRWGQFDLAMLGLLASSVVTHTCELLGIHYSAFNLARAPRPFIMIRYIRASWHFSMPKARLNQIFKRSSQQINNVTLFFVFFLVLYGLLGVQFFGELHSHCVREDVEGPDNVTVNDLTIPDTFCRTGNQSGDRHGLTCREGFKAINSNINI